LYKLKNMLIQTGPWSSGKGICVSLNLIFFGYKRGLNPREKN
jgi:hypothetical protein